MAAEAQEVEVASAEAPEVAAATASVVVQEEVVASAEAQEEAVASVEAPEVEEVQGADVVNGNSNTSNTWHQSDCGNETPARLWCRFHS